MSLQAPFIPLSPLQVAWAASHDWFVASNKDGTITVKDTYTKGGLLQTELIVWVAGFKALKDWAGY